MDLTDAKNCEQKPLVNGSAFDFIKSGSGHDMHFLTSNRIAEDDYKVEWYCWHLDKGCFEKLEKHGLPPTDLDYDLLMDRIAINKHSKVSKVQKRSRSINFENHFDLENLELRMKNDTL